MPGTEKPGGAIGAGTTSFPLAGGVPVKRSVPCDGDAGLDVSVTQAPAPVVIITIRHKIISCFILGPPDNYLAYRVIDK
jgi:hypothetical protein